MRIKESVLVLSLVLSFGLFGCRASNQYQYRQTGVQSSDYRAGDYQEEIQKKEWRRQQEGKGRWAGQYKSGKPVSRIPVQPGYNGYRSFKRGFKRGRH